MLVNSLWNPPVALNLYLTLAATFGWLGLELGSPHLISACRPKVWSQANAGQQREMAVSVVGFTHGVVSSAFALYSIFVDLPVIDSNLTLSSPVATFGLQLSLGYFVWDLFVTTRYGYGIPFLFHAVLGLVAAGIGGSGIVTNWMVRFMLYELSTPFLHMRQHFIRQKNTTSMAFSVIDWCFRLTFFGARLVFGTYMTYMTFTTVLPAAYKATNESEGTRWAVVVICCISGLLYGLNFFWIFKMIHTARKRAARQKFESKKAN